MAVSQLGMRVPQSSGPTTAVSRLGITAIFISQGIPDSPMK